MQTFAETIVVDTKKTFTLYSIEFYCVPLSKTLRPNFGLFKIDL